MHPVRGLSLEKDRAIILVVEMGKPWRLKEFVIPFDQKILDEIYGKWEKGPGCY